MGELKRIAFEEQPEEVKDRVKGYWSKRADSFAKLRKHEMKSNKADRWLTEILTKSSQMPPWKMLMRWQRLWLIKILH